MCKHAVKTLRGQNCSEITLSHWFAILPKFSVVPEKRTTIAVEFIVSSDVFQTLICTTAHFFASYGFPTWYHCEDKLRSSRLLYWNISASFTSIATIVCLFVELFIIFRVSAPYIAMYTYVETKQATTVVRLLLRMCGYLYRKKPANPAENGV